MSDVLQLLNLPDGSGAARQFPRARCRNSISRAGTLADCYADGRPKLTKHVHRLLRYALRQERPDRTFIAGANR